MQKHFFQNKHHNRFNLVLLNRLSFIESEINAISLYHCNILSMFAKIFLTNFGQSEYWVNKK